MLSTLVLGFLDTLVLVSVMQNIVPQIFMIPLDMCVAFLKIVYLCCCRRVCWEVEAKGVALAGEALPGEALLRARAMLEGEAALRV